MNRYGVATLVVSIDISKVTPDVIVEAMEDLTDRVHGLLSELGLSTVPCDWSPDADTISDQIDNQPSVLVLDLNPEREG